MTAADRPSPDDGLPEDFVRFSYPPAADPVPVPQPPGDGVRVTRKTDDLFTWTATVRFATTYDLPDGVVEQAVVRAIRDSTAVVIDRLERMAPGVSQ